MSRLFYHVMQDNVGNLLFDVSGTMRLAGTGTLATIYGDEALTVILPNPMTNHPSYGSFKCFLGAGDYDFYMAKAGYTFETLTGVQGHGTMAQQDASAVAITGGTAQLSSATIIGNLAAARLFLIETPVTDRRLGLFYDRSAEHGIVLRPNADTGTYALMFMNQASAAVGGISTSGTATTYGTTSDSRLKHAVEPLTGALQVVRALRPVAFRWNANDEPGEGFLAHELMRHVPAAVAGQPEEVNPDGSIKPQQIDHSRLVVWLVAAVQELASRVVSLEEQLGI